MKEKKYIDRLYQEKFRDFEAAPREVVWRSIAAKLREEEKKPVVGPFWSRMAGAAAILIFLLLMGDWFLPKQTQTGVANEETRLPASSTIFQPQNTRLSIVSPEIEAEPSAEIVSSPQLASNSPRKEMEERKLAEVSAIEMASKNAILENLNPLTAHAFAKVENKISDENEDLLLDALKDEDTEIAASGSKKGFEISTRAAPIYYGNLGKGNFIDPRFNYNNSEGEMTYSYGVKIAYNLNEKVKIRSGVNRVNMSYNTGGVAFQAVAGKSPIKNISLDENSTTVTSTLGGKNSGRTPTGNTNRTDVTNIRPGELNQKMGYIEVPLELEYNLFAEKFELNLIGGASTLFLAENEILLNAETVSLEGRANNLNNVSFSTNIGLGLDYNLSKKFKLNLEPMLKYQLNTFENATSDTRPYYFGIYSGFSYKF